MGQLLHHAHSINEYIRRCGKYRVFRGTQREPVRNSRTCTYLDSIEYYISQLNILSNNNYNYVTQIKLHQSNNALQHTHNPVDEEDTKKLIKVIKVHNAHTRITQYNISI